MTGAIKSWTIWFNTVGIALLVLVEEQSHLWIEYTGDFGNITLTIIMIANLLLRAKTNKSLTIR